MNPKLEDFFVKLEPLLQEVLPLGNQIDYDTELLENFYQQLIQLGGLHLLIPLEYGGLGGDRETKIEYNIKLAQYSGALLLLQAQHQSVISKLKKTLPNPKVENLFTNITKINSGIGIYLAANKQLLNVTKENDGYRLSGSIPWVTGFNFYQQILISFNGEDTIIYGLLPFQTQEYIGGSITISDKIPSIVFSSTNTVKLALRNWYFSNDDILYTESINLKEPAEHPAIYNLAGATKALLNIASQGPHFQSEDAMNTHQVLEEKWHKYQTTLLAGNHCPLQLRAMGLQLAEQSALFARVVCGANGLLESNPLTRICREIWQYTIAGYNEDQRNAYYQYLDQ